MSIACSCYGVRDAEITDVIRDGACSVDEVTAACNAGSRCGCCQGTIEMLLRIEGVPTATVA